MATVNLPSRRAPREVFLRLRHPDSSSIIGVTIDGKKWAKYDARAGVISLGGLQGAVRIEVTYGK